MKLDIRKYIRCLLFVLPFLLSSCNQEDDINEIFVSGQWQLVNYYTGIDWNNYNANAKPTYTKPHTRTERALFCKNDSSVDEYRL